MSFPYAAKAMRPHNGNAAKVNSIFLIQQSSFFSFSLKHTSN
jgi:hypothetical protein